MRTLHLIDFEEAKFASMKKAFEWAVREQQRLGCTAEMTVLKFDSDFLTRNKDGCIMSLFVNPKSGQALLRRDWLDDGSVFYNSVVNSLEVEEVAPKSASRMRQNALDIYRRFCDGPKEACRKG